MPRHRQRYRPPLLLEAPSKCHATTVSYCADLFNSILLHWTRILWDIPVGCFSCTTTTHLSQSASDLHAKIRCIRSLTIPPTLSFWWPLALYKAKNHLWGWPNLSSSIWQTLKWTRQHSIVEHTFSKSRAESKWAMFDFVFFPTRTRLMEEKSKVKLTVGVAERQLGITGKEINEQERTKGVGVGVRNTETRKSVG